jgi:hypothetical protein
LLVYTALTSLEARLATRKLLLCERSRLALHSIRDDREHKLWNTLATFRTISRVVFTQNVSLACRLMGRSELFAEHVAVAGARVFLTMPGQLMDLT